MTVTEPQADRAAYERDEPDRHELEGTRREFIDGRVVQMPLVSLRQYDLAHRLARPLKSHEDHAGGLVSVMSLMCRAGRHNVYPDVCYWPAEVAAGFTDDQGVFPPPTLVAEVMTAATADLDRGVKFNAYAADGVAEYLIVDHDAEDIEQYALTDTGTYALRGRFTTGTLDSVAVHGLILDLAAIFA